MPTLTALLREIQTLSMDAEVDAAKAETGNKAAGTQVRKAMQAVKAKAQEVRKAALQK